MRGLVAFGLLSLLALSGVEAQQQPVAPDDSSGLFKRGRELLAAARYPDAADAFNEYLSSEGRDKFTVRVAVYCDVSNLDAHLRRSGNPPELFLLRRSVRDQPCFGLFWGLFSTRSEAARAAVPAALRRDGHISVAISPLLVSGVVTTARPTAPSRPAQTAQVPAPAAPLVAAAPPRPQVTPVPPTEPPEVASVSPTPATVAPSPAEARPVHAEPARVTSVPRAEIGLGSSYLWDDRMGNIELTDGNDSVPLGLSGSFKLGWVLSGTLNVTDHLGIVGEASGHYRSQDLPGSDLGLGSLSLGAKVLGLHTGLRYTDRGDAVATPYAQALFGVTRFSVDVLGGSETETDFSIQPGVGVMFKVSDRIRIGVGGDYRLVFTGGGGLPLVLPPNKTNELRFHVGVVFGLGRK
jgi:opacity protein-like surface antigen